MNQVIIIMTEGPYKGQRFKFEEAKVVRFGRASDCEVRLQDDRRMSRYHCELEISLDPPQAQIYDLGSLHGTFVNDVKYGGREGRQIKHAEPQRQHPPAELKDGDELRLGRNVIQVEINFVFNPKDGELPPQKRDESHTKTILTSSARGRVSHDPDKTVIQGQQKLAAHDLDKTVIEGQQKLAAHDLDKTVIQGQQKLAAHDPDKTVIQGQQNLAAHDLDKTVIEGQQKLAAHDPDKTVIQGQQKLAAHDPDKTVIQGQQKLAAHDLDKTVIQGQQNLAAHDLDKTVIQGQQNLAAHDLDKTVIQGQQNLAAHDLDKTVIQGQQNLAAHDLDKTVVTHTHSHKPAAQTQPNTIISPAHSHKPTAQTRPNTVISPAHAHKPAAQTLDKTVINTSSSQNAAVRPPARPVLTLEQQQARRALLDLLSLLGLKALNEDPKLGAYVIEKQLGQGGFGKVFRARHRTTQELVAIKVMRPRAAVNEYVRESFKREIDNTRSLFHPNIVRLLEDGSVGNMFYFMMEFCDGGNANHLRSRRGGKIPLHEALPIMKQILQGLSFIHERGYIHRDLKPDNILLTNTPRGVVAKIADLGLTKGFLETGLNGGLTVTGLRIGTGPYMSREQLTNFKYVGTVSDVWSIGATFYVMLTGQQPRQGPPHLKHHDLILNGRIIPIRHFEPSMPLGIANVIDRSLVIDTKKRYQNATEMLNALERVT